MYKLTVQTASIKGMFMHGVPAYCVQGTPLAINQSNLPGWGQATSPPVSLKSDELDQ